MGLLSVLVLRYRIYVFGEPALEFRVLVSV